MVILTTAQPATSVPAISDIVSTQYDHGLYASNRRRVELQFQ